MSLESAAIAARKRAFTYEPRLVRAVTALLRAEMRAGANRVRALDTLHVTEGEVFPEAPDTRRLLLILEAVAEAVAGPVLAAAPVTAAVNPKQPSPEDELRVSFTASNPLVRSLLDEFGLQITLVTDGERRRIVEAARTAYAEGLSVVDAARLILSETTIETARRATMIARTMLIGAANGASLAAVRMTGAAPFKSWLATQDARCRPEHLAANGQTVPVDKPFQVGGYALHYPGDPNGPADMVVNCRCTVTYADSPLGTPGINSAPLIPALAAAADTLPAVEPVSQWSAVLALEGVPTSDGRFFEVGSFDWRTPPLTLYGQFENAEGHDEAPVIGRIDSITRVQQGAGSRLVATGVFDSGDAGLQALRMVTDQTLRGISADISVHEAEFIDLDSGGPIDDSTPPDARVEMRVSSVSILAATLLGMPAFEEATVAITADAGRARLLVPLQMTITRTIAADPAAPAEPSIVASVMAAASDAIRENRERDREDFRRTLEALADQARDNRSSTADFTAAVTAAITATHEPTPVHLHAAPITVEAARTPHVTVEAAPTPNVTIESPPPAVVNIAPAQVKVDVHHAEEGARMIVRDENGQIIGSEPVTADTPPILEAAQ